MNKNILNKCISVFICLKKNVILENDIIEFKKLILSSNFINLKLIKCLINIPNSKYYIGIGKLFEIKNLINKYKIHYILLNITLKSNQERNLYNYLNCNILDKTNIILNIFRIKAKTYFGKLQTKLAYLNYLSTRLVNRWSHLERQKGGIKNVSGPGEKQIEIDKRIIKKQIRLINIKLLKIKNQKNKSEYLRSISNVFTVSLVGYTNSGKSTLFNLLTRSNLYNNNTFFSTLDTYIKKIKYNNNINSILISDTIGFMKDLPSSILEAFKSTLNEINNSKLILHIIDISNMYFSKNIDIVNLMLNKILKKNIPIIQILNKIDKIKGLKPKIDCNLKKIWISAKYNLGIDYIFNYINNFFSKFYNKYKLCINYNIIKLVRNFLYKNNLVIKEYSFNGIKYYFDLNMTNLDLNRLLKNFPFIKKYIIKFYE